MSKTEKVPDTFFLTNSIGEIGMICHELSPMGNLPKDAHSKAQRKFT
jgi:hypothetical protein